MAYLQKHIGHPLIALRLPRPRVRDQLRDAAVANSTSPSEYVRQLILDPLEEENAKRTLEASIWTIG